MDLQEVARHRVARARAELALAPDERLLAGGTWLFSQPQPGVKGIVDLTGLGWAPWEELPDGGLRVAATCTIEQVQSAPWPSATTTALARHCAEALLMSWKVQQAATVGGNLCLALPAGAMIALTAALDGEAVVWTAGGGERRQPVTDLVRGPGATTLLPGDVLRGIDLPGVALRQPVAFRRIALTTYGRSSALVVGRRTGAGVRVVVTAATPRPWLLPLFATGPATDPATDITSAVAAALSDVEWFTDVHGPADWRAAMTHRLVAEVVTELLDASPEPGTATDAPTGEEPA